MSVNEVALLLGAITSSAGAYALIKKHRSEIKKNTAEAVNAEVMAIKEAYSDIVSNQVNNLVKPLQARVTDLERRVDKLQKFQSLFEVAVMYIRSLCHWIETLNLPEGESKPRLPDELREYFIESDKGGKNAASK